MKVTRLHQIELTSHCNLRCKYCAHPTMPRQKMDMDDATFERAIELVRHYVLSGTQDELNLCGIGESTIHPKFAGWVQRLRQEFPNLDLTMATNGLTMTAELAQLLAANRVRVWVSIHRPEKAGPAIEMLREVGALHGVSADAAIGAVNWAGQVQWHQSAPPVECMWLKSGRAFIMSDGRIGTCCFDGQGTDGIIGTVWDDPALLAVKPYSLCSNCYQEH